MPTIFKPTAPFGTFPPPVTFSKHSKETVNRKPSYLQACVKRNRFRTQSRSLLCISGLTTTANCIPTLLSSTKQLRLLFAENGQFKLPDKTDVLPYLNVYKDLAWTSMPLLRKIALITGIVLTIQFGHFEGFKKRWLDYVSGLLKLSLVCQIAA